MTSCQTASKVSCVRLQESLPSPYEFLTWLYVPLLECQPIFGLGHGKLRLWELAMPRMAPPGLLADERMNQRSESLAISRRPWGSVQVFPCARGSDGRAEYGSVRVVRRLPCLIAREESYGCPRFWSSEFGSAGSAEFGDLCRAPDLAYLPRLCRGFQGRRRWI